MKGFPLEDSKYYKHLQAEADKIDAKHFKGKLKGKVNYSWNSKLNSSGGVTVPHINANEDPTPTVYLSKQRYLSGNNKEIRATLKHEMIHASHMLKGKEDGHSTNFKKKMDSINRTLDPSKSVPLAIYLDTEKMLREKKNNKMNYANKAVYYENSKTGSVLSKFKSKDLPNKNDPLFEEGSYKKIETESWPSAKIMLSNKIPIPNIRIGDTSHFTPSDKIIKKVNKTSDLKEMAINQWTNHFKSYLVDVKGVHLQTKPAVVNFLNKELDQFSRQEDRPATKEKYDNHRSGKTMETHRKSYLESLKTQKPKEGDKIVPLSDYYNPSKENRFLPDKGVSYDLGSGKGFITSEGARKYSKKEIELHDKNGRYNGTRMNIPARKYAHTQEKIDKIEQSAMKDQDYRFSEFADFDSSKKIHMTNKFMDDASSKHNISRTREGLKEDLSQNDYYNKYIKPVKYENKRTQNAVDLRYVIDALEKKESKLTGKKRPQHSENNSNPKKIKKEE